MIFNKQAAEKEKKNNILPQYDTDQELILIPIPIIFKI